MKTFLSIIFIFFLSVHIYAQKNYFPYRVTIKDTTFTSISSLVINNNGKPIMVEFFSSTCGPCINLLNSLNQVYKDWKEIYGLKIFVISIDQDYRRKKTLQLIRDNGWTFDFYFDKNNNLYHNMAKAKGVPQSFIYDGEFNLIKTFIGAEPNYGYYYKIVNGDLSIEKIKINPQGKYSHLDCNLTQYESILEYIKGKNQ